MRARGSKFGRSPQGYAGLTNENQIFNLHAHVGHGFGVTFQIRKVRPATSAFCIAPFIVDVLSDKSCGSKNFMSQNLTYYASLKRSYN